VTLEVRPFGEEDLAAAAVVLADRHRRHRAAEPLLPAAYEEPEAARAEIEALWRGDGVTGAAAVRHGRLVGYMLGAPRPDSVWGQNGWIELAGHAAAQPEDVRDLYAAISQSWVDDGRVRHYALVPASDAALVEAWFRLSFGQQQAYGIRAVDPVAGWPAGVRHAEPRDVDALVASAPVVSEHQERAPTFAFRLRPDDPDELRADIEQDIASPEIGCLVAEIDGRVVGCLVVCPVEMSSAMHVGLARPPGQSYLAWAGTVPGARGRGVGVALTEAAHAWAREAGYTTMVIDFRVANLLASRFWLRRGFRPTFFRLSRSIP
jgi:ribosomal protein S18 acetylase RimI-like enzyme